MNGYVILAAVTFLGLGVQSSAIAQNSTAKEQLVGTWTLVSSTVERDGTKVEPFGSNPIGYMIFTASGHFAWNLMRADRPKFASGNRATGTVEENKAAVQGNIRGRNHSEKDYRNQWGSTKVFHSNRVHWWFVHQYTDTCQVRC